MHQHKRRPNSAAILSSCEFLRVHTKIEHQIKKLLNTPTGKNKLCKKGRQQLKECESNKLYAINFRARIVLATALHSQLSALFKRYLDRQYYFHTLSPKRYAFPLSKAILFDFCVVERWARKVLGTLDYIACIEAGLYTNCGVEAMQVEPTVSIHVHAIVWVANANVVPAIVDRVNAKELSLYEGSEPAHKHHFSRETVLKRVYYSLKFPCKDYRLLRKTGFFTPKKRNIRPGDAVKMARVLTNRTMKELTFASGKGESILRRATSNAVRRIKAEDDKLQKRLLALYS